MRRLALICVAGWLTASVAVLAVADEDTGAYSSDAYATCAACHLPDGVGVPGAFPPIRNRTATIAGLEGGREYLATVVSYGLMGMIEVDGVQYFGVMAGNSAALSAEEIAAGLNYIIFELSDDSDVAPFTAEEVETVQAGTSMKSPTAAGELRSELVGKHGAEWP